MLVTDDHPGGFQAAGKWFGFRDADAEALFGAKWHGKNFLVHANGKQGKVKVWRNKKSCQMNCGRWLSGASGGDWSVGDKITLEVPTPQPTQTATPKPSKPRCD